MKLIEMDKKRKNLLAFIILFFAVLFIIASYILLGIYGNFMFKGVFYYIVLPGILMFIYTLRINWSYVMVLDDRLELRTYGIIADVVYFDEIKCVKKIEEEVTYIFDDDRENNFIIDWYKDEFIMEELIKNKLNVPLIYINNNGEEIYDK